MTVEQSESEGPDFTARAQPERVRTLTSAWHAVAVVAAPTAILELRHSCAMLTRAFSFFARHNLISPEARNHPSFARDELRCKQQ